MPLPVNQVESPTVLSLVVHPVPRTLAGTLTRALGPHAWHFRLFCSIRDPPLPIWFLDQSASLPLEVLWILTYIRCLAFEFEELLGLSEKDIKPQRSRIRFLF